MDRTSWKSSRSPVRRKEERPKPYGRPNNPWWRKSSPTDHKHNGQPSTRSSTRSSTRGREGDREMSTSGSHATSHSRGRRKAKTTPAFVFSEHRAQTGCELGFCGFYWHSTRLAKLGTNAIFDWGKKQFQSAAVDGRIGWDAFREILFGYKRLVDQPYRNMMWHFRMGEKCEKCEYWDEVYQKHLAHVDSNCDSPMDTSSPTDQNTELTDQEMLEAVDASS
uniref:Non-structural protein NP-1 n=1 Tax=Dromedary camel bocaparvovirus 1 TaxID=2014603 RepID=A0A1Z3FVW6_9VIRU|nr:NP1 [Dromedary camel bocaparvovirus 1]